MDKTTMSEELLYSNRHKDMVLKWCKKTRVLVL